MPFWKYAVVVIVLAMFTATLRHRLLDTRPVSVEHETCVTATILPDPDRWFVVPPLLRPEEGGYSLSVRDHGGVRPAYCIAAVLHLFAMLSIFSDGWLTKRLIICTTELPLMGSVAIVGAAMTAYHTQRMLRGLR